LAGRIRSVPNGAYRQNSGVTHGNARYGDGGPKVRGDQGASPAAKSNAASQAKDILYVECMIYYSNLLLVTINISYRG
jgi:hypothetical protein